MSKYFEIGAIAGAHGIQGEIRVFPLTDEPSRFQLLDSVDVRLNGQYVHHQILSNRLHKNMVILKLSGVNNRNDAEKLKGGILVIPPEKALPLSENQYYYRDLIGLAVKSESGEHLGDVYDILETGANDVYVVRKEGGNDLLLPAVKEFILKIDLDAGEMIVHLWEGLKD